MTENNTSNVAANMLDYDDIIQCFNVLIFTANIASRHSSNTNNIDLMIMLITGQIIPEDQIISDLQILANNVLRIIAAQRFTSIEHIIDRLCCGKRSFMLMNGQVTH